ncbi:VOC family protein [Streptomyces liangshanensis]|uniref:VOC family protein n=1 Tax=Streptomyces liangshanensis TaxID=2717324 RepID=A0A6G9H9R4_9ACTN|nr:VOC family protein [Streptomyces liangshanensis]QIQ07305.1 VOC family protein [Streptomyces liangshanensis]
MSAVSGAGEAERDKVNSQAVAGAPCWVTLLSRELPASQAFYGNVLGWSYRAAGLGDDFCVALSDGMAVAGIGALASSLQVAVSWTPYFAVADVDEAAARIRERGATVAVGPLAFHTGRAALAMDPDGAAFGIWEGAVRSDWTVGRGSAPAWLELRTRDTVDAARFYGQVLGWAPETEGGFTLVHEEDHAVLRQEEQVVARIRKGAVQAAPDPRSRPRWHVYFRVGEVSRSVEAAVKDGGAVVSSDAQEATLRDPDGALFTVTSR